MHKSHDIRWHPAMILVGNTKKQSCTNLGSNFLQLEWSRDQMHTGAIIHSLPGAKYCHDIPPSFSFLFPQNLSFFAQVFQVKYGEQKWCRFVGFSFVFCFFSWPPSLQAETLENWEQRSQQVTLVSVATLKAEKKLDPLAKQLKITFPCKQLF